MKYYHAIYIVLKYFASFTGNENDIFEVNSRIQLWRNIFKYGGKKKKVHGVRFFPSLPSEVRTYGQHYVQHFTEFIRYNPLLLCNNLVT